MDAAHANYNSEIKRLERTNPLSHKQLVDVSKYVKNLSVRYLSSLVPNESNLDDWIVLPLFQEGQDIPIENDGRTAILLAHAPTLKHMLKTRQEKIANEQKAKEANSQQTTGKRKAPNEGAQNRKRKGHRSLKGVMCWENNSQNGVYQRSDKLDDAG
ncbi:hypothetical protein KIN20_013738 [Parelaphostrongylus tenuis]|uniref:Uncharacterized protein n=1 Tax=Parelaphostrongylus tenuis TaxID=148309 RepID=A0AAD5N2E5_PARTN|nr:hypothetical protein KIN20_013738 [Parelaphostrongylus tenuis]